LALQFHNTLTGTKEIFAPRVPGQVRMYTCGPTVHDRIHIGNFRTFLFEDVLRRYLRYSGYVVTQVMNITDVEDKIIRKAREAGVHIAEYTAEFTRLFFEDAATLGMEPAEHYPRATDYIPQMVQLISRLREGGHTYERDGSVYFRLSSFPGYGKLSKIDLSGSRDGVRIDADEYEKDDPKDFVLWKAAKPAEDFWESPFGPGRPGWHIECSAMAMTLLGESFDIHAGGVDNIFPHHENEIAQSESATGKPFARYWLHAQHLAVGERKMAKSLGNFVTLGELLEQGHDPMAVRYLLISLHYRTPLQFSDDSLAQAASALKRLRDFAARLRESAQEGIEGNGGEPMREPESPGESPSSPGEGPSPSGDHDRVVGATEGVGAATRNLVKSADQGFRSGMDDDLNVPKALAAVFGFVREGNFLLDQGLKQWEAGLLLDRLRSWDTVLGVLGERPARLPLDVEALVLEREEARSRRDFARSDQIRGDLLSLGYAVEDTPSGPRVKKSRPGLTSA
jgi:cysteinyl-tRNA synthetase